MVNKILAGIVAAAVLVASWYILGGLRGGSDLVQRIEDTESAIEQAKNKKELLQNVRDEFANIDSVSAEYESALVWLGNPNHTNPLERDTRAVCTYIRDLLSSFLDEEKDHIVNYSCSVGVSEPFSGNVRRLPLQLSVELTDKGDAERLIKKVDNHISMLLLKISASRLLETAISAQQALGNCKVTSETVSLDIDFYLLAEEPEEVTTAALAEADRDSEIFDAGLLRQQLLENTLQAVAQAEEPVGTEQSC